MLLSFTRTIDGKKIPIIVEYDMIEVAPDYMVPKLCYLFFKPLDEIEDFETFFFNDPLIVGLINVDGLAYFAGAKLNDGWVELYYYTSNSKALRHHLLELLPKNVTHEIGADHDEKYKLFFDQLKPTASELLSIENKVVLEELEAEGDDLEAIHVFEHTFFFEIQSQREKCKVLLEQIGHTIEEEHIDKSLDANYVLVTTHEDKATLDVVNDFTDRITQKAKRYSGYYDGWSTSMVGEADE